MPRTKRVCPAGEVFHVLNRAVGRWTIFEKPADYEAFVGVAQDTWDEVRLPIFAMVVMPNHWHFVVRPTRRVPGATGGGFGPPVSAKFTLQHLNDLRLRRGEHW